MAKKSSIIYSYCCGEIGCDEEYVGESRTFGERFKEHLKTPSPMYHYQSTSLPYNINGQLQDPGQRREQYGKNHPRSHVY